MKKYKNSRLLYLFFPFVLVPYLGGAIGIFFIINFYLSRNRLVLIAGCIGIAISVITYLNFGFDLRTNKEMEKGIVVLSTKNLNTVAAFLELYKLRYAEYPDSLQQLRTLEPHIELFDIIQQFKETRQELYNYKNSGKTYILFFSGLDGIPHTSDDIYPTITE